MRYCVCRSIFEEEGQEGKDGVNEEGEDESVDYKENDESTAHYEGLEMNGVMCGELLEESEGTGAKVGKEDSFVLW